MFHTNQGQRRCPVAFVRMVRTQGTEENREDAAGKEVVAEEVQLPAPVAAEMGAKGGTTEATELIVDTEAKATADMVSTEATEGMETTRGTIIVITQAITTTTITLPNTDTRVTETGQRQPESTRRRPTPRRRRVATVTPRDLHPPPSPRLTLTLRLIITPRPLEEKSCPEKAAALVLELPQVLTILTEARPPVTRLDLASDLLLLFSTLNLVASFKRGNN